jgi:hypothetical protein
MAFLRGKVQFLTMIAVLGVLFANFRPVWADSFTYQLFKYPGSDVTYAQGINDHGIIFGLVGGAPVDSQFLYENGQFSLFPGLVDINDQGMILANTPAGPGIFFQEQFTPLHVPGSVVALNDTGSVLVTGGFVKNGIFHPVAGTSLRGINDQDEIVGTGTAGGFLYNDGVYTTIDFPGSVYTHPFAINDHGVIVGNYYSLPVGPTSGGLRGFIYENGNYKSFDPFGCFGSEGGTVPTGINDSNVITGYQLDECNTQHGSFVATPSVPEPGTLGLLGTGGVMLAAVVRRRRHQIKSLLSRRIPDPGDVFCL